MRAVRGGADLAERFARPYWSDTFQKNLFARRTKHFVAGDNSGDNIYRHLRVEYSYTK